MTKTAYIFDLDYTIFDTAKLKAAMPQMCHQAFPRIKPTDYQAAYDSYFAKHDGNVDMPAILHELGKAMSLDEPDLARLPEWLGQIPYREYYYPGADKLLSLLGDQAFFLTKGDRKFQLLKIAGLGLAPELSDSIHLEITETKDPDTIRALIEKLRGEGYGKFVFINDNIVELERAYSLAPEDVTAILMDQSPYADENRLGARTFPYRKIKGMEQLFQNLGLGNSEQEIRYRVPNEPGLKK